MARSSRTTQTPPTPRKPKSASKPSPRKTRKNSRRPKPGASPETVREILAVLSRTYPDAHCELEHSNALELLIATILSAQCTDKRVNLVTKRLFERCKSAADYASIPTPELEALIESTGFFRAKARSLKACAAALLERHGGRVPDRMEELTALAGVGRKTANVVLGNAFGLQEGIVVDTHVRRLSQRLGLTSQSDPGKIEADLLPLVPRDSWGLFSHWLIWHGRRRCFARKPNCSPCELRHLCPSAQPAAAGPNP